MVFSTGRCLAVYDARYLTVDSVSHKINSVYLTALIKHFQHTPTQLEYVSFSHLHSFDVPLPALNEMFQVDHDDTLPMSVCLSAYPSILSLGQCETTSVCLPVFLSAYPRIPSLGQYETTSVCLPVFLSAYPPYSKTRTM